MSNKHDRSGRGRKHKADETVGAAPAETVDMAAIAAPTLIERAHAGLTAPAEVLAMEVAVPPAIEVEFDEQGAEPAPQQMETKMVNETIQQSADQMRAAGEQFRGAAESAMGTMNEQTQAAVERNTRAMGQMGDFARGNVDAMVQSTRIATEGYQALGREAADLGRKSFEGFSSTMRQMAEAKTPADVLRLQGEWARQSFDLAVSAGAQMSERMVKLGGEIAQPFQSRMAEAAETMKGAVAA